MYPQKHELLLKAEVSIEEEFLKIESDTHSHRGNKSVHEVVVCSSMPTHAIVFERFTARCVLCGSLGQEFKHAYFIAVIRHLAL